MPLPNMDDIHACSIQYLPSLAHSLNHKAALFFTNSSCDRFYDFNLAMSSNSPYLSYFNHLLKKELRRFTIEAASISLDGIYQSHLISRSLISSYPRIFPNSTSLWNRRKNFILYTSSTVTIVVGVINIALILADLEYVLVITALVAPTIPTYLIITPSFSLATIIA